MYRRQI